MLADTQALVNPVYRVVCNSGEPSHDGSFERYYTSLEMAQIDARQDRKSVV